MKSDDDDGEDVEHDEKEDDQVGGVCGIWMMAGRLASDE